MEKMGFFALLFFTRNADYKLTYQTVDNLEKSDGVPARNYANI